MVSPSVLLRYYSEQRCSCLFTFSRCSGASTVAIDNKIEQAMVSILLCFFLLYIHKEYIMIFLKTKGKSETRSTRCCARY